MNKAMSAEQAIKEMYEKGMPLREIQKKLNISTAELYYFLGRLGLPLRKIPEKKKPLVTYITGPRKTGTMLLPIPKEIKERLGLKYRDGFEWSVTSAGSILLKKLGS